MTPTQGNAPQGMHMIIGHVPAEDPLRLQRWEYWLTMAGFVVVPRPAVPDNASMECLAMIDHMEQLRLHLVDGIIVISHESQGKAPWISLSDWKLIFAALQEGKKVFTTQPICGNDVLSERAIRVDSLEAGCTDYLWEFTWQDYRQKFEPKKKGSAAKENAVVELLGEKDAVLTS